MLTSSMRPSRPVSRATTRTLRANGDAGLSHNFIRSSLGVLDSFSAALDAGVADHPGPAREIGFDQPVKSGRVAWLGIEAELFQLALHFAHPEDCHDLLVHAIDDRLRRTGRKREPEPAARFESRVA